MRLAGLSFFFFFNDTATTEIYTLSLHDALPISDEENDDAQENQQHRRIGDVRLREDRDRKSTRLNSSHLVISYAVFCLKKKKKLDIDQLLSAVVPAIAYRSRPMHINLL